MATGHAWSRECVEAVVMSHTTPVVFVVDDDPSVRASLETLIDSAGWRSETFPSAAAFLRRPQVVGPSCLILDVSLPDLDGLELQKRVASDRTDMPIIFISGYGDVPLTVQAMRGGAVEFLTKPLVSDVLLSTIGRAIERSRAARVQQEAMRSLSERHASLSRREREIMDARFFRLHKATSQGQLKTNHGCHRSGIGA
jgi:FixJ family two-component response regulator